jgi:hypothetical protein
MAINTGIVRIFNTYGPRMAAGDGRIVTNFVQAMTGRWSSLPGRGGRCQPGVPAAEDRLSASGGLVSVCFAML